MSSQDEEIGEIQSTVPLLHSENEQDNREPELDSKHEARRKETIQFYVEQLTLLFYPLLLTFSLVCWIEITLAIDNTQVRNPLMYYDELPTDSTGVRLGGSVLNAIIVVCGITAMTFMFVLCFKYGFYKFLYLWLGLSVLSILGITTTALWIELMNVYQAPLDYITMFICTWNFSLVGLIAIFWNSPLWLQQAYLIAVSTATAVSLLRMPQWTTWAVLMAVSIYDLFAVLCPAGPLSLLISIAEERQENIPALIYSAGMAGFDDENSPVGGYPTQESNSSKPSGFSWFSSSSKGYHTIENEQVEDEMLRDGVESLSFSVNELTNMSNHNAPQTAHNRRGSRNEVNNDKEDDEDDELNAIKLGLGDFIFYSVLVGKASRTDSITLCLCVFAILTGLSITILILTLNRKALPALPISILFGSITYAIAFFMTSDMVNTLSLQVIQL